MKKNMTKCVIGLLFICVLFLSCNFAGNDGCLQKNENKNSWGELVIYNQTSSGISDINYCGERFVMWYNSYSGTSFIGEGKKVSAKYSDEETGYVFFEIHTKRNHSVKVRTNEIITVKKGEKTILSITDNTLVVVSGKDQPVTVLHIINNY